MRPISAVIVIACALLPWAVRAERLKAGLWEITVNTDMGKNAPQMPQLSPEQLAQMKQMGVKMPAFGAPHSVRTCISPEQAASGQPPIHESEDSGCKPQDFSHSGGHTTGKIICNGNMQGTGTVDVTMQGDEAYTSKFHFEGSAHGHPVNMTNTSTGRWVQASCN